jgi:adenine-specific DNA-methyltransferase
MDARGEIYWSSNGNPRRKIYLDESNGVPLQDIWYEFRDVQNQNMKITGYPTEKNAAMLNTIIQASSQPGDLVLDCFAGSGTTLDEAAKLERNWIGMDKSPEALSTMLRRFAYGAAPMGDYVKKPSKNIQLAFQMPEQCVNSLQRPQTNFVLFGEKSIAADEQTAELLREWEKWIQRK